MNRLKNCRHKFWHITPARFADSENLRPGIYLLVSVFLLLFFPRAVLPNSLTGEFTFKTRVPDVALVYFSEDKSLSQQTESIIDQANKEFKPKLVVGAKGSRVAIKNSDTINHNSYALDKKLNVNFDTDLQKPGSVSHHNIDWAEGNVIRMSCKIHPRMKGWIACISSQYYKVVQFKKGKKNVKFEIKNIPDGLTKVKVWLPRYLPAEVAVKKGESKTVELQRGKKVAGSLSLDLK